LGIALGEPCSRRPVRVEPRWIDGATASFFDSEPSGPRNDSLNRYVTKGGDRVEAPDQSLLPHYSSTDFSSNYCNNQLFAIIK